MKEGDNIQDNDPRIPYRRILEIVSIFTDRDDRASWLEGRPVYAEYVLAKDKRGARYRIKTCRIYSDGKTRRSGFTLLGTEQLLQPDFAG